MLDPWQKKKAKSAPDAVSTNLWTLVKIQAVHEDTIQPDTIRSTNQGANAVQLPLNPKIQGAT